MSIFGRDFLLTVDSQDAGPRFFDNKKFTRTEIRDLRVTFSIKRTLSQEPNTAKIEVTNSRLMEILSGAQNHTVSIDAGFADGMSRVYSGDVSHHQTKIDSADIVTSIEAADGYRAFGLATIFRTWSKGTPLKIVASAIASTMDLRFPDISGNLPSSFSASGNSHKELTRLLDGIGVSWSVQNGKIRIPGTVSSSILIISEETGMIGSPSYDSAKRTTRVSSVGFFVQPGDRVVVKSKFHSGEFTVNECEYKGDTHGNDWNTDMVLS
jgi:hypothetical protein